MNEAKTLNLNPEHDTGGYRNLLDADEYTPIVRPTRDTLVIHQDLIKVLARVCLFD